MVMEMGADRRLRWSLAERLDASDGGEDGGDGVGGGEW